jgi:polysaccharide biosynthesis protein
MTRENNNLYRRIKIKIETSEIATRMAHGAFWSFSGTALAKLVVLLAGIACAHVLDQKEYGKFNMVRSTINLFIVFGAAGLGLTATKYIAQFKSSDQKHISSIYILTNFFAFGTGCFVTTAIFFLAPTLANRTLNTPELTSTIQLGTILLFLAVIDSAQQGTLAGFEDFKSIAINTLIGSISESSCMLIGGYFYGVNGAILGYGCGFIALYLTNNIAIRRNLHTLQIRPHISQLRKEDLKLLYTFSLPAALSSIMIAPTYWIIRTMLVRNTSFSELAIYEAADQWKTIILFIPTAVSQIVLPILSSIVNEDQKKYKKILYYNISLNAIIATILSLIICVGSNFILSIYGKGFTNHWTLIFLAISTIFTSISSVVGLSISSRSKMWTGFSFNILWGILVILFSHLFLQNGLASTGISLAILCSYIIHAILQIIYLRHIIK